MGWILIGAGAALCLGVGIALVGMILARRQNEQPWALELLVAAVVALLLVVAGRGLVDARDGCHPIDITDYSPTGIAGCELDGETTGIASWWGGSVAATNWCVWPWTDCGQLRIRSVASGKTITVDVAMFCDCYTGTTDERLVDLTRGQVLELGLDPARGLFDVVVTPLREGASSATLPNTAMQP